MSTQSKPGQLMSAEIAEQPHAWSRFLADGLGPARQIAEKIREHQPRMVLLAARGTSDHAALYGKYLIETHLGIPAGLASPSVYTVYGAQQSLTDVLWITISQSGGSPDLVDSTRAAREQGALTIALTNSADSPLANAARFHLDVLAGPEQAVAATKSYTSQLLALWSLIDLVRGGDAHAARQMPDLGAMTLARDTGLSSLIDSYRFIDGLVLVARGYSYSTAREAALKIMETSYLAAQAFSGADLMHGPIAVLDGRLPVLAMVPAGPGGTAMTPVLERLHALGNHVTVVGEQTPFGPSIPVVRAPEDLAPLLQILPLQRLALGMSLARGINPDAPRGLAKLTRTT